MPIILTHSKKSFGQPPIDVLKEINLIINDGEFVAITGRSGSGKSTLLYILSTLDTMTEGEMEIDGRLMSKVTQAELHAFRNQNVGFVFQFHYLLPELTVLENILMPVMKNGKANTKKDYALYLLERFGILAKQNSYPSQISGGESQRAAIARALIMKPRYIFADEPTGNLDTVNADTVMGIFKEINQEQKTTIIMVTHDPDYAAMATRQIHLVDGRIVSGQNAEILPKG